MPNDLFQNTVKYRVRIDSKLENMSKSSRRRAKPGCLHGHILIFNYVGVPDCILPHVKTGVGVRRVGVEAAVVLGAGIGTVLQGRHSGDAVVLAVGQEGAGETGGGQGGVLAGHVCTWTESIVRKNSLPSVFNLP